MKFTASIHSIGPFYLWYALMCERTGIVNFLKNWEKTWELFIVTRKALGLGNSKAEKKEVENEVCLQWHFVSYCMQGGPWCQVG